MANFEIPLMGSVCDWGGQAAISLPKDGVAVFLGVLLDPDNKFRYTTAQGDALTKTLRESCETYGVKDIITYGVEP